MINSNQNSESQRAPKNKIKIARWQDIPRIGLYLSLGYFALIGVEKYIENWSKAQNRAIESQQALTSISINNQMGDLLRKIANKPEYIYLTQDEVRTVLEAIKLQSNGNISKFIIHPLPESISNGTPLLTLEIREGDTLNSSPWSTTEAFLGRILQASTKDKSGELAYLNFNDFYRKKTSHFQKNQFVDTDTVRSGIIPQVTVEVYSKVTGKTKEVLENWVKNNPEVLSIVEEARNQYTVYGYRDFADYADQREANIQLERYLDIYNKLNPDFPIQNINLFRRSLIFILKPESE